MKSNTLFSLVAAGMLALSGSAFAGAKSYQVTGPVIEVNDSMIVVTKGKERFEIDRDSSTKVTGDLKVGDKVTIMYTMTAKDVEVKAFAGWRFNEALRAGIDNRIQVEVSDEANPVTPKTGREYDLTAGPAVSWMASRTLQFQALVGVAQPKKTDKTSPVGVLSASFDF